MPLYPPNPTIPANATDVKITDGVNTVGVFQFHNSDNQSIGATYGVNTGTVAQLINASGNLDRQRATAADVSSGVGAATGVQQLAWPVTVGPVTSGAITGSGTPQTITLTSVTGTVNGVTWTLVAGATLVLDANTATQEAFTVTAVNTGAKTVTGVILNNHGSSAAATGFFYGQARSVMIGDGANGQGVASAGTYLFNGSTFDRWKSSATTGTALVSVGMVSPATTLNAVTANTTGTAVDAGASVSNWAGIAVATGSPTAGTLTLELSVDNTNWVSSGSVTSITAAGNYLVTSTGRPARYARVTLTSLAGTITLTVKMMGAG